MNLKHSIFLRWGLGNLVILAALGGAKTRFAAGIPHAFIYRSRRAFETLCGRKISGDYFAV